jgi:hypothetical protein
MMDNPVAKIGSENFALYGPVDNKANAGFRFVTAFDDLIIQFEQAGFEMSLKIQGVDGISFVFPGIVIGLEQVNQ